MQVRVLNVHVQSCVGGTDFYLKTRINNIRVKSREAHLANVEISLFYFGNI